jgi:hypothetical protein
MSKSIVLPIKSTLRGGLAPESLIEITPDQITFNGDLIDTHEFVWNSEDVNVRVYRTDNNKAYVIYVEDGHSVNAYTRETEEQKNAVVKSIEVLCYTDSNRVPRSDSRAQGALKVLLQHEDEDPWTGERYKKHNDTVKSLSPRRSGFLQKMGF